MVTLLKLASQVGAVMLRRVELIWSNRISRMDSKKVLSSSCILFVLGIEGGSCLVCDSIILGTIHGFTG